jgi:hypothetical protein
MGGKIAEKLRERSLQKSQGLLHESTPIYERVLSYFSLYSLMLLLGTTPLGVQRFVVHTIQPFAVAGLTRLLATLIRNPWLSLIPLALLLFAVLRYLYRAHKKSLLQQSKIFSLANPSSINYSRKSEIQASQPPPAPAPDLEAPLDEKETETRSATSACLEMTIIDPEIQVSMSKPRLLLGAESVDEEVESKATERKMLTSRTASNVSRTRSRPLYRGMFSLPDDEEADVEDGKLRKVRMRTKERRESTRSARRGSQDHCRSSLTGGLQRTFSHLLRMVSMSEDTEKERHDEGVEFDDPELSDSDFSSEGSRFDYSSGSSSGSSDEWIPSSTEEE